MSSAPLYQVINKDLSDQIMSGLLRRGQRLSSEAHLAKHYGVSRMTLRQALGQLETEGLVVRLHGKGTFVAEQHPVRRRGSRLDLLHEQLGVSEEALTTKVLLRDVMQAPSDVARSLGLGFGQRVINVKRLRLLDSKPIAVQESWIPYLLAPALVRENLVRGSLYLTLERVGIRVAWAEQEVSATVLSSETAGQLDVTPSSPALQIQRVAYMSEQIPIEFARSYMRGDVPIVFQLER